MEKTVEIPAQLVFQLNDRTGAPMNKCEEALKATAEHASNHDVWRQKAEEMLLAQGFKPKPQAPKDDFPVPAKTVNELRQKTGAGMGLCKDALRATKEHAGNQDAWFKAAEEWLRKKGVKGEVLARATAEGVLIPSVSTDGGTGVLIELKCETDFAARNERFRKLAHDIAAAVHSGKPASPEHALTLKLGSSTITVDQAIKAEIAGVIKENIKFDWFELKTLGGPGRIGTYVHSDGKLAVLVGVLAPNESVASKPEFAQFAKDVAMHIAGAAPPPVAVDRASVPKDQVETERKFVKSQLDQDPKDSKKPDSIKEKIIDGKMGRFYKERCLLEQLFVKDDTKTVEQYAAEVGKTLGGAPTIAWFVRRQLGS
jgi:elongation factor Ts